MKYHTPAVLNTKINVQNHRVVSLSTGNGLLLVNLLYLERSNPKENDTSTNKEHTIFHVAIFFSCLRFLCYYLSSKTLHTVLGRKSKYALKQ